MADLPKVSVVIATYNRSRVLRLAIASVLAQDLRELEVWVVGDGCTDDSAAVTASFADARVHWTNLPRNGGSQSFANTEGVNRARGQYVAFLGHDDLWMPWHLTRAVSAIETSAADIVHSLCVLIGPEGVRECVGAAKANVRPVDHFVPPSAWVVRREALVECGPWPDPDQVAYGVDFVYWKRLLRQGRHAHFFESLDVLKFPSPWFKQAYRNLGVPPQENYWPRLAQDPSTVERDVLLALANKYAQVIRGGDEPVQQAVRRVTGITTRRILDVLGRDGGLISPLMVKRMRKSRRKVRGVRGLD